MEATDIKETEDSLHLDVEKQKKKQKIFFILRQIGIYVALLFLKYSLF